MRWLRVQIGCLRWWMGCVHADRVCWRPRSGGGFSSWIQLNARVLKECFISAGRLPISFMWEYDDVEFLMNIVEMWNLTKSWIFGKPAEIRIVWFDTHWGKFVISRRVVDWRASSLSTSCLRWSIPMIGRRMWEVVGCTSFKYWFLFWAESDCMNEGLGKACISL